MEDGVLIIIMEYCEGMKLRGDFSFHDDLSD
mgnify:FL=1